MTNVNNGIELKVILGINDIASKTSLNTQIADLEKKLNEVKIDIKIDPRAVAALDKLATMDFSKLTQSLGNVEKATKALATVSAKELQAEMTKASEAIGVKLGNAIRGSASDIDYITKQLAGTNAVIDVKFNTVNGVKELKALQTSIEKNGITQKVTFEKVNVMGEGESEVLWMPKLFQETNRQLSSAAKNTNELIAQMNKLQTEGKITNQQFEELTSSINKISGSTGLARTNQMMDEMVATTKKVNANLVEREQIEKRLVANQQKIQTQILTAEKAMKSNPTLGGSKEANDLVASYQKLNPASKNFKENLFDINTQFTKMKTEASSASRDSMGMMDAFREAMKKFPIWMAASTIFYGTVRTATEFASIIVDIDTKMTNLVKVMSSDTDFEAVFDRATESAEKFGQSISQALDAYTEFSRQGFKGEDLGLLADAGLVASNVGEMTAQQASEYMTASLIQWKKDAKDSMGIIDSWNEISNNYATTTEKLAQGQARAGATARAMGLDFDQLNAIVGTVTASTKQSGNEIGNFVKASLPRLVGKPAQDALSSLGISLTDNQGNLRDIIQVYTEVAQKVKGISDSERIAVVEGLAGKYHIARMQVLLDDLGSADSMYRNMYESSKNSAGSANEENERYMESLQARINLARVEVEKLALAFGDAFLTEGMIQGIQTFGEFLGLVTKFVDKFGVLPALLGTTGVAIFLLSSNFRKLTGSIGTSTVSLLGFNGAAKASATASALGASAVRGFSVALKGLLASTVVGIALVGVGVAIEALLGKMERQRKLQEDIALENTKTTDAYNENKDTINELSAEYTELEKAMKTAKPDSKTSERYFEVQNELAALMPTLVTGETSYGDKLIDNAGIIESRIKLIEQRAKAEQALQDILNAEEEEKKAKESEEMLSDSRGGKKDALGKFREKANESLGSDLAYDKEIKNIQDMEKALTFYNKQKTEMMKEGYDKLKFSELLSPTQQSKSLDYANVESTLESLDKLYSEYKEHSLQMETAQEYLTSKATENADKQIDKNKELSDSSKNLAKGILYDATLMAKSAKETDSIASIFGNVDSKDFQKSISDASTAVTRFVKSSNEDFASQKTNLEQVGEQLKKTFLANAKDSKGAQLGSKSDEYKNIEKSIDSYVLKLIQEEEKLRGVATAQGISREEALLWVNSQEDAEASAVGATEAMDEYIISLKELTSVEEQLAGVSKKQIDEVDDLLYLYKSLSSQTDLTADQTLMLQEAQEKLLAIYPDLSKFGSLRIEDIENEKMAQEVLLEAIELSKDGKLTAEEEMTLSSAINTKAKIEHKKQEILALAGLALAYQQFAKAQAEEAARLQAQMEASNGAINNESAMQDAEIRSRKFAGFSEAIAQSNDEYSSLSDALEKLESDMNGYTNSLGSANERVKESEEAQKKTSKETKNSIYYTDKFASALERINLAIEKQNAIQSKYSTYSKQYQDSLRKESALLQQKLKLTEDQIAAQKKQINSGKIAPKGLVNTSSSSSSSGKGAYSGKYSTEINRAATTYNIDPHLIAAVIKAESSFNPNAKSSAGARGLMQLMPATARELGVKDSYNVEQNIMGGVKYLSQQLKTFGGDIEKALAAYNAGAGNVRKYGGIPPFKETQNYIKKVMAEYNSGFANVVSTATKQLSGWTGTQTGKMGDPRANGTRKHNGIDIAQPNGTRLDANVGGKVIASGSATSQGYDKSYGNLVVVQDESGNKHFYAHLEKAIAKLGSTIVAGTQLGTIGSTGASTGNHLHYGVQKDGKFVDPTSYVNNARKGVATSSTSSSASNAAAETAQMIDQAKSDLISLEADALAIKEAIEQLESDLINSQLAGFDKRIENYQKVIDAETNKLGELDLASKRYQASLQRQYEFMGYQKQVQEEELAYINKLIRSGSLSNKVKDEMIEKAKELTMAIQGLDIGLKNITFDKIMVTMKMFSEEIDDVVYGLDRIQGVLGTLEEGTAEYTNEMKKQIPLLEQQKRLLIEQRESLQRSLLIHKLTPEQIKDIEEQIEDLGTAIWGVEGNIVSMNKEIAETGKRVAEEAAEALIDAYKSYLEEKRDMHEKSLDAELKAEDERHKKVSDNLKKELDDFRKIVQEKLDAIDKEESQRSYDNEIDDIEAERLKVLNKINLLSLDDSLEAKAERKRLEEELARLQEEIAEKQHAREIELRKENLTDIIEDKETEIAEKERLEDERYDAEIKRIDDLKEYWNQFYEDQMNDEARFAQIRKDIVAGNFDALSIEFQGFMQEMKDTMPDIENTLDGTMQAVGTSIRENLINQIQEALTLLKEVGNYQSGVANGGSSGGGSGGSSGGGSGGSGSGGSSSPALSGADLKVAMGKFLLDHVMEQESNPVRKEYIRQNAYKLANGGRAEGSKIDNAIRFDQLVASMSHDKRGMLAGYMSGAGANLVSTPALQEFIREYAKKIAKSSQGYDSGGITPSWGSSGKLGILHEEEMILNKKDTSSYKKLTGVLDSFLKFINPIRTTPIGQPVLANGGSGESPIQINFNVENMNATQKEADGFAARIQNNLRRNRGVK